MAPVVLHPQGPFSLAASIRFLEGFAPAAYPASGAGAEGAVLRIAFPVEGSWEVVGVAVRQLADGTVTGRTSTETDDPRLAEAMKCQLARILSLDVDASGLADVGRRDPVAATLLARYAGLRPVCFWSPYEAACWAVIGQRIRMLQAAAIKKRLADAYGDRVVVDGVELAAFPSPRRLLQVLDRDFPGLPEVKITRLRGLAEAALQGRLDAARLRSVEPQVALDELTRIPGIGPFSAELVLVRGAGAPDVFPAAERRLHQWMDELYGARDLAGKRAIAEAWTPFRSWVALLLRIDREDRTARIGSQKRTGTVDGQPPL